MFSKTILSTLILTVALFALAACGGSPAAAPAEPAPEATEAPAEEAAPTEEPAAEEEAAADEAAEEEAPAAEADTAEGMRTFVVAPDQSTASYLVDEEFFGGALDKLGINAGEYDIVGSTQEVSGQFELNLEEGTIGANEFTVQIDTLSTDQDRRDNWVREQDPAFAQFPIATFVATGIENAPSDVQRWRGSDLPASRRPDRARCDRAPDL